MAGATLTWQGLELKTLHTMGEFRQAVVLQQAVWSCADSETVPAAMFVVAEKIGGLVLGAYEQQRLVAFLLALPGRRDGVDFLHAHMLAVAADKRNLGLGTRLMWWQRELALQQGITRIEWTFDPLEIKNAWLYLERLGAVARQYVVNQYGVMSSALQGGLPSDRLLAEWWLQSERVKRCASGSDAPHGNGEKRVTIPAEIYEWKARPEQRAQAAEVLRQVRQELTQAFAAGGCILGYERRAAGDGCFLLGPWPGDDLHHKNLSAQIG